MDLKSNMNMDWKSIFFVVDYETIYQKRTKMVNNRDSRSVYRLDRVVNLSDTKLVLWDYYASNACGFVSMALLHSLFIPRHWR